jgi:hypothetical protein
MADERDRLRARLGLTALPAEDSAATPAEVVDEQTKFQAMQAEKPKTGAERAADTIQARKDRFAAELAEREATKPTEDPGPGNIWSYNVAEGRWKKVFVGNGFSNVKDTKDNTDDNTDDNTGNKKVVSTYTDPTTGDVIAVYSDNTTAVLSKGTKVADFTKAKAEADALAKAARQSAYDLLFQQFDAYGLGGLVTPLKNLIESGISPAEFTIRLRETDAYKKRFAANATRIQKGLRALSEAEYIGLEDQYQDVMRRYGLPDTYYTRGEMGRQEGFEKFIGGDVSPVELEDRIGTAQRRVLNAAPQIKDALTQYYGNEISNGDILAYVLDPQNAIENIKRKVTAAEIGGAASIAGLGAARSRAEELQSFGVTGDQARQGYNVISEFLPQARVLGERYAKQGLGDYTQETAESEVFAIPGSADAGRKRRKLAELEQAQFSGSTGLTGGALGRERAGQF